MKKEMRVVFTMADDSEREEESDFDENLITNDMFPDMPAVKKEIFNYYDSEFESTPFSVDHVNLNGDTKPVLEEGIARKTFNLQCTVLPSIENSGNNLLKRNKIILGSKPNRVSVDEDDLRKSASLCQSNDVNLAKGPQLSKVPVNENYFEELVNCCSEPNVVLQDIQSYLNKSKRFCEVCSILFPEPSGYDSHVDIYHTDKDIAEISHERNDITKRVQYKCTICGKYFVAGHVLRRHVKNIHKSNDTKVVENDERQTNNLRITHNNCTDLSNTCFHCKQTFDTQKSLIEHLYDILQMKRKETEIVPVLKSVLFKCNKCDINFTSSQFAADHAEHMEMLVNWKCGICYRIFKKEDELSHERQHSVSNHFVTYNLEEIDASKILFRCSKCGVHFSESNFLYHFRDCGLEATKSVHCKICDIFLDYNTLHESDKHTELNNFTIIRTDVMSDNPVKSTVKEIKTRDKLSELHKSFREVKVVLQRIDSGKLNACNNSGTWKMPTNSHDDGTVKTQKMLRDNKDSLWRTRHATTKKHKESGQKYKCNSTIKVNTMPEPVNKKITTNVSCRRDQKKRMMVYFYCANCKCFITNFRKTMHKQGHCIHCPKFTCKLCGLILTRNSMMTHKRLHEEKKDLQLNNFRFYNLYNGRSINPPVPEYPECTECAVRFLSKSARHRHVCSREAYSTCNICQMKLSEAAFKLHMTFHQYSMDGLMLVKTKHSESNLPLATERTAKNITENEIKLHNPFDVVDINSSLRQNSSLDICEINASENEIDSLDVVDILELNPSSDIDEMNASENEIDLHNSPNVVNTLACQNSPSDINKIKSPENDIDLQKSLNVVDMPEKNSTSDIYEIIYTCGTCSVSVDTYDKAVEHCQGHYKNEDKEILTELCSDCNLKIDKTCYTTHHNLHEQGNEFKFLKFDSYYLPAENDMWIKHVFRTLPKEKVFDILSHSIYRFECRIKLDVVQQGDPHLTVYKCDKCCCFIEPNALFKHSENSCFKLRQHPCTHCGLPFNSSTSRIEHEKIHNRPGITINSYRIVAFNREQDKHINRLFCLRKNYVLYKCRSCDVIIDKLQRDIHQCDFINVKKCPYCALLLLSIEYEKHINTHKEFISFSYTNMKVIIFGEDKSRNVPNKNTLKSTFKGAIFDYKMYICKKCEICIKNEKCMPKHICNFETQQSKCLKCGLYFSVGRLKTHTRSHERDPDFVRSNMNIVYFDPCTVDQNKNATLSITADYELSDSNTDSESDVILVVNDTSAFENRQLINGTTEPTETARLYKCPCALHFLNEDSLFRHFGVCRSKAKISKQKCPKCDLLFTPNILFTHLLAHHSNKSRRYKYDILEMDNTQISMLQ